MAGTHVLHKCVQELARGIAPGPKGLAVSPNALEDLSAGFSAVPPCERHQVSVDLTALALQAQQLAGDRAAPLISQIFGLLVIVVRGEAQARQLLEGGGVDLKAASTALGREVSAAPVSSSSLKDGRSLLALRLGVHK